MSTTATPPAQGNRIVRIEPHLEQRQAEERRAGGRRRRLLLLGAVLAVAGLGTGAWFLLHSAWFAARSVAVTGVTGSERAEVVRVAGLGGAPPLISVDPGAVSGRIERLPWVATATVARSWPDHVTIAVTRRRPAAVVRAAGGTWAEVDRAGRVLAVDPRPVGGLVPVALATEAGSPGSWLPASARPALRVAAAVPPALRGDVAAVSFARQGGLELRLTSPLTVYLGSTAALRQKFEDAAAILSASTIPAGDVIDVSVPDAPLTGPSPGGSG